MLRKLTQIEDEMDECLMSVDFDDDDVIGDVTSGLRRTCSENVRGLSSGRLDGDNHGCRKTGAAMSKSDQALSRHCGRKQEYRRVGGDTTRGKGTSGIVLTDDDAPGDGGVFLEVFPLPASPVVITSAGTDVNEVSYCQTGGQVPGRGVTAAADGLGSSGNYFGGLARSTSDVTSQRRFHRRRSLVKCPSSLAPISGRYLSASHLLSPPHGHSCFAIDDPRRCDPSAPDSPNDPPQPEVEEPQPTSDESDNRECASPEPGSGQFAAAAAIETDRGRRVSDELPLPSHRRSTTGRTLETSQSSQSLDVAITVEICDADEEILPCPHYPPINIPPVTISSHTSSPDDESSAGQKYVVVGTPSSPMVDRSSPVTSGLSSPALQGRLNFGGSDSNPNFLSVSRTGTVSSGSSSRTCSRRPSSHQAVVDAQDIISVDNEDVVRRQHLSSSRQSGIDKSIAVAGSITSDHDLVILVSYTSCRMNTVTPSFIEDHDVITT